MGNTNSNCNCRSTIDFLQQNNNQLKKELFESKSQISILESNIENFQNKKSYTNLLKENSDLNNKIKKLKSELDTYQINMQNLLSNNNLLKQRLEPHELKSKMQLQEKNSKIIFCINKINESLTSFDSSFIKIKLEDNLLPIETRKYLISFISKYSSEKLFGIDFVENLSNELSNYLEADNDTFILFLYKFIMDFDEKFESLINFNKI